MQHSNNGAVLASTGGAGRGRRVPGPCLPRPGSWSHQLTSLDTICGAKGPSPSAADSRLRSRCAEKTLSAALSAEKRCAPIGRRFQLLV